jgi:hypothetical protein
MLVQAVAAYLALGVLFAIPFTLRWAGRLDAAAIKATPGFRLIILPGAVLLWPVLALRLGRGR